MKVIFHGHSCVQLEVGGKSLIIDPFISGNPAAVTKPEDIKTDAVLLTHAHADHILDAAPIAIANNAPVVATVELATYIGWKGVKQTIGMNIGGTVDLGFAKATMIHAFHTSGITLDDEQQIIYGGMPAGYIIEAEGKTILHAGDTGLFSDMKMFGELYNIDLAILPMGGHFTMGPEHALIAAKWLNAKHVLPVHYNTFPPIRQDVASFVDALAKEGIPGTALEYGGSLEL
ncbi:metal-dependent hydrolase [Paenibacillus sp. FSL R7-0331]|uniref:metal-dependent hydrolase n=1 Tax=Paenibacillus sp. FSL R7-0331 TaxID=1536773 RepID=UPI0004F61E7C|nr:metal-dependent hydrolase [Paenibacillus sp. FSL R7-0331]AIQ53407.1 metal-dependent hydrolase [Paenibacillus sp. FSL R7-0331]